LYPKYHPNKKTAAITTIVPIVIPAMAPPYISALAVADADGSEEAVE
jgi:hypothetical protein